MSTYTACVVREGDWWVVTVAGVGVTQARHLADIERQAAGLVQAMTGERGVAVEVDVQLPAELRQRIDEARRGSDAAARAQVDAAVQTRAVVGALLADGTSQADIATLLGVSRQRVSQLARGAGRSDGERAGRNLPVVER